MRFLFSPVVISSSQIHSKFNLSTDSETVQVMRWGLIPSFVPNALEQASSYKFATSNARAENILERPSYMDCIKHRRRCVVIAQGYIFRYSELFLLDFMSGGKKIERKCRIIFLWRVKMSHLCLWLASFQLTRNKQWVNFQIS